jgi:hypothetical protein
VLVSCPSHYLSAITPVNGKEKAYHELFCSDDENMCGLDCYPCIDHGERSLDMIERFIKDREAAWTAKKVTQGRVNNRKGKKHISNEPGVSNQTNVTINVLTKLMDLEPHRNLLISHQVIVYTVHLEQNIEQRETP